MRQILELIVEQIISGKSDDELYFKAIDEGDEDLVKRMVESYAKKNGYNYRVYHGTRFNFHSFDPEKYLTDNDQLSGPGINTTDNIDEAKDYGYRIIEAFAKSINPARIENNVTEILSKSEKQEADSATEPKINIILRRLLNGTVERYGFDTFVIKKARTRKDLGFIENSPFVGEIDTKDKALEIYNIIKKGPVYDLDWSIEPSDDEDTSHGTMNRKIIQILKNKGYDSIVRYVKKDNSKFISRDSTHRILFDPNQIKLADPITKDDQGNIIPLSQRFDSSNPDIRY